MFDTIVWATDGSEASDSALPLVTELAGVHGSKIVAVHVNELFHGRGFGGSPMLADEDEVKSKIRRQVGDLREAGFEAVFDIVTSQRHDTAELIAEQAANVGAELIVVGTHGRGTAASMVLGSVANGLNHAALCPVLSVPPTWSETPASLSIERALA